MKKYKCLNCGQIFDEDDLDVINTSYESYYGVDGEFGSSTPLTLIVCPHCHDEDLEEIDDEEMEDEE